MSIAWDAKGRPGLQTLLENLRKDTETPHWTEHDLRTWLKEDRNKSKASMDDWLRHLRFMESYSAQPVMLHGTRYQFLLSGRLYYAVRQQYWEDLNQSEGFSGLVLGYGALQKDLKCLKVVAQFLGLPTEGIWPVAPQGGYRVKEAMPMPELVYELIHADYTPDPKVSLENAWVKHVAAHYFGLGARPPKEYWFMRETAYQKGAGLLKVIEPKKRFKERDLFVEPTWLADSPTRPSLDTWLIWREKIRQKFGDLSTAMYPNPLTGRDFPSPEAFEQFLHRRVQPRFPWFHGYLARHWSVYARIIDGGFTDTSYNAVAEWHGHDSVDMTREVYGPGARAYSKSPKYGENWLSRAFQKPRRKA